MKSQNKWGVEPKEKYDCAKCEFHKSAYSKALGEYVHACTYISKNTAWACKMEEGND